MSKLPIGSPKRAVLCKKGATYSKKCYEGDYWNQGIGNITGDPLCGDSQDTRFHIDNNGDLQVEFSDSFQLLNFDLVVQDKCSYHFFIDMPEGELLWR